MMVIKEPEEIRHSGLPVSINIRTVPPDLRKKFRRFCMDRDTNMSDVLIDVMQKVIDGKISVHSKVL